VGLKAVQEAFMSDSDYVRKLDELDQLLNDPDIPMQPDRIWSLLADLSRTDIQVPATMQTASPSVLADR
jgi:hypothetical protein